MPTKRLTLDRVAVAIGVLALAVGVLAPVLVKVGAGVRLAVSEGRVVVWWVDPYGPAARFGVQSGMVAIDVNGRQLVRLPEYVPGPDPTPDPITGEQPPPRGPSLVQPAAPAFVALSAEELQRIADADVLQLQAVQPDSLGSWNVDAPPFVAAIYDDGRDRLRESMLSVIVGIGVLFSIAWWLTSGRAGPSVRDLGVPLAVATAAPFLLRPLDAIWGPASALLGGLLLPAAMVPLAVALVDRIRPGGDRTVAWAASATCAVGGALLHVAGVLEPDWSSLSLASTILFIGIPAVPGFLAAGPVFPGVARGPGSAADRLDVAAGGRLVHSTEMAVAGVTPGTAIVTTTSPYLFPFILWIGLIAMAGRFTIRPLARLVSRAQLQRDLVVAATEAERARVAADIHDDALQELTLLVRRLDAAGDAEGAEIARTVSERLRAICGDLRLPILDDLGVGPALDWLVLRIERLAGGEVRLERADGSRPPADVELAFFRIAQEALSNAVKHGRPPIVVRYRSTDGAASLSIDDAGAGIDAEAGERAEREGRLGLLNMQQRAEGIGAILDVRPWPAGGTHVQLEWRAR